MEPGSVLEVVRTAAVGGSRPTEAHAVDASCAAKHAILQEAEMLC